MPRNSSKKRMNQGRTSGQLSKSAKDLGGYDAANHLGNKTKHDADVIQQQNWILDKKARKLGIDINDLNGASPSREIAIKSGFSAEPSENELMGKEASEEAIRLLGSTGLVLSLACIGEPGQREWKTLDGEKWVSFVMNEKRIRGDYVDKGRHYVKDGLKPVETILARVPPWTASELGEEILSEPSRLKQRVEELSAWFSERYNVDAIAAVVHRESAHDLHVHLLFSRTREVVLRLKPSGREAAARKKLLSAAARKALKAKGEPSTNREISRYVADAVAAGEMQDPQAEIMIVENRRCEDPKKTVARNVMGHAFRCKLQIWRAADHADQEAIAARYDKPASDPYSFRGRLIAAEKSGQVLEDFWWDLALAEAWDKICKNGFSAQSLDRVAERGCAAAKTYATLGTTTPGPLERIAAEKQEIERERAELNALAEAVSRDKRFSESHNKQRAEELEKRAATERRQADLERQRDAASKRLNEELREKEAALANWQSAKKAVQKLESEVLLLRNGFLKNDSEHCNRHEDAACRIGALESALETQRLAAKNLREENSVLGTAAYRVAAFMLKQIPRAIFPKLVLDALKALERFKPPGEASLKAAKDID